MLLGIIEPSKWFPDENGFFTEKTIRDGSDMLQEKAYGGQHFSSAILARI